MEKTNVLDILKDRGFVFQTSDEQALRQAFNSPITLYQGFDPTADSLHLGHLMSLVAMHYLQEAGHKVIFLLGGGTARVGDPTGKNTQRVLLDKEMVTKNATALRTQVEKIGLLSFEGENAALMLNNDDWLSEFKFMDDFLIGVAKYFSVNEMIKARTFAKRLEDGGSLSLLEFCYSALQAWDFLELNNKYNCTVQMGGADQWFNCLQGIDLVRKNTGKQVLVFTLPLLTTAGGQKMGKTDLGPIWLDAQKTSPFEMYQYLIKTPDFAPMIDGDGMPLLDADGKQLQRPLVRDLLRLFTEIPLDEIDTIIKNPKEAQKRLAFEVTKLVHGEEAARDAEQADSIPEITLREGLTLIDALVESKTLPSNSEVRRRVEQKAVSMDGELVTDANTIITKACLIKYGKGGLLRVVA